MAWWMHTVDCSSECWSQGNGLAAAILAGSRLNGSGEALASGLCHSVPVLPPTVSLYMQLVAFSWLYLLLLKQLSCILYCSSNLPDMSLDVHLVLCSAAAAAAACLHSQRRCSVLQWNPDVATQLVVASDDDRSPTLQMWDLRNSMSPVKEFVGHTKVRGSRLLCALTCCTC